MEGLLRKKRIFVVGIEIDGDSSEETVSYKHDSISNLLHLRKLNL